MNGFSLIYIRPPFIPSLNTTKPTIGPTRPNENKPRSNFLPSVRPVVRESPAILVRSEEHTSELQSLLRNSYAVYCLQQHTSHKQLDTPHILPCIYNQHPRPTHMI